MGIKLLDKKLLISLLVLSFLLPLLAQGFDFHTMEHEATVTLSPNISSCDIPTKFTVNITNNAGYGIYNVKIYKAQTNILDITCGPAPTGWNFRGFQYGQYCEYDTDPNGSYVINPEESLTFTFNATLTQTECVSTFRISTLDNEAIITGHGQGEEENHYLDLNVDCHAPNITKIVGSPKIPGVGFDWWVTSNTLIKFSASDSGQCDLGMDYCRYRIIFDNSPGAWNIVNSTNGDTVAWQFYLQNDSVHKIEVECYDIAGNKAVLNETDKVDNTPPNTTKIYGEPYFSNETGEWITSSTPIYLNATDGGPICAVGVDKTWYIVIPVENYYCESEDACEAICLNPYNESCKNTQKTIEWCQENCTDSSDFEGCVNNCVHHCCDGRPHPECGPAFDYEFRCDITCSIQGSSCRADDNYDEMWNVYKNPFTIPEESCHLIQYFSVDYLGNIEPMKWQCVFVDNTPPVGTKTIGDPKISCGEINDSDCWWVRDHVTEINLTCEDQDPHPVNNEEVCFRVSFDDSQQPWLTDQYCNDVGGTMEGNWCCVKSPVTIIFKEDSLHDLEYYCRDALGNANEPDLEYFKVDSQPPIIEKTIIGPQVGDCPPEDENDKCWIKDWTCKSSGTTIHIEAYDNDTLGCAVDQITCDWWYILDGNQIINRTYMQGLIPPFDIKFYDDTEHELHVKCCDALGNCYEDVETFYVDSSGPNVTKEFIGPWYNDSGVEYIDTATLINLTATDNPDGECAVDNSTIYWRDNYFPNERDWHYCLESCAGWNPQYPSNPSNPIGEGWNKYEGPFNDLNESCHVLEYYAVDALGNVGPIGVNCFFSDHTKPVVKLTVGTPSKECENQSDCDYWVRDHVTQIYLNCENRGPHPSPLDKIQWRIWNDITGNWTEWYESQAGVEGYDVTLVFTEDSLHKIQYKCNDTVGKESNLNEKVFRVDSQPPVIEKEMFGNYLGDCPPENLGDVCYVADNNQSGVNITVHDNLTYPNCAIGDISCEYVLYWETDKTTCEDKGYTWVSEPGICIVESGYFTENKEIYFKEDSTHHLYIYCEDALGNSIEDMETFLVDSTPPVTIKKYGTPKHSNCTHRWITNETQITLNATDNKVGVDYIKYRVTLVGDDTCPENCNYVGNGSWIKVNGNSTQFNINEDSCHLIEYYSVDKLGNEEAIHKQCVMVDNKPPIGIKTIGEPNKKCENQSECNYWVTQNTQINLTCTDQQPHPVDNEKVCYKVYVDGNDNTANYCTYFGGTPKEGYCCFSKQTTLNFLEDSNHTLEFYCEDVLGNRNQVDVEKFKVDTVSPETNKTYGTPYYTDNISEWITSSTPITLTATDGGEVCAIGMDKIYYRVELVNDESCWDPSAYCFPTHNPEDSGWIEYTAPFTINEESCHKIEYYSVDKLGNKELVRAQCVFVDNTPPTLWKEHSSGMIKDNDTLLGEFHWMTKDMQIDLYCKDEGAHPVNQVKLWYRVWDDISQNWSEWIDPNGAKANKTITFSNDSVHKIQYYCEDILGNSNGTRDNPHEQIYKVDSTPPNTTKNYLGPYYVDENGSEYIDTASTIELTAEDGGEICAVGVNKTYYRVTRINDDYCYGVLDCNNAIGMGNFIEYLNPFNIDEESCHLIEYYSVDRLGNTETTKRQCVFVDKKPPIIKKDYVGPYFTENGSEWINSNTEIFINVTDPEPHPSGLANVSYRITLVDDEYCWNQRLCQEIDGNGSWQYLEFDKSSPKLYLGIGNISEYSCHLIEIKAVDMVNKSSYHKQCVFVDNKAPVPNKTVGKPRTKWDGKDAKYYDIADRCWSGGNDSIECWKVTLFTPITLDCIDPEPHPVDHEETCFKVGMDGDDKTEFYCNLTGGEYNKYGDGFCCGMNAPYQFRFNEQTEHNLEYYCVDVLGNKGPIDEEKFKVEEASFNITINKKWNLISVPFVMLDNSIDEVFKDIAHDIISVWTYDGETGEWYVYTPDGNNSNDNLHEMKPGWGYWVLARNDTQLVIGGSLFTPGKSLPERKVVPGWNLIGYYGTDGLLSYNGPNGKGKIVYEALDSLLDKYWVPFLNETVVISPKWSKLITYWEKGINNTSERCDPIDPLWKCLSEGDRMDPGAGYWIMMKEGEEGIY